jgi:hypothetical protein
MMKQGCRDLITICLIVLAALFCAPGGSFGAPEPKTVRVLYLVPEDRAARQEYIKAIEKALLDLQVWYYGSLGGRTFRLNNPMVEVRRASHKAAWYSRHRPAVRSEKRFYTFYNALADAAAFGVKVNDRKHIWLLYIDAPGRTAAGMRGVAVMPEHDLLGLVGRSVDRTPVSRWIGGSGHELGHALGLSHPGERQAGSLMQRGHVRYPACFLPPADTARLRKSRFIYAGLPEGFSSRDRFIYTYNGGYVVHVGGGRWQERRTDTGIIYDYKLYKDDGRFLYLARVGRGGGTGICLPKKAGGSIYRKDASGGLVRIHATG